MRNSLNSFPTPTITPQPTNSTTPLSANDYCMNRGGVLILTSPATGYTNTITHNEYDCAFGKAYINANTLLNYHNGIPQIAIAKFLNWVPKNVGINGNPASLYCTSIGGKSEPIQFNNGTDENCLFSDGSKIASWTMAYGPSNSPALVSVLQNP